MAESYPATVLTLSQSVLGVGSGKAEGRPDTMHEKD